MNSGFDIGIICKISLNFLEKRQPQRAHCVRRERQSAGKSCIHDAFYLKIREAGPPKSNINASLQIANSPMCHCAVRTSDPPTA